jgi:hypothetical protein
MRAPWRHVMLGGTMALVAFGCSSDDTAEPEPTPLVPTTADFSTSTSISADTTLPGTSTTTDEPTTTSENPTSTSDITTTSQLPSTTALAPPSTLIAPAPAELDPGDPNNQHSVAPEDEPIVTAYRQAVEAELITYSRWPLDPDSPELVNGPFTARVMGPIRDGIAARTDLNQVLDISSGITLRPYVVEDDDGDPDRVFVWDCQIDATFWKDVDTGEKAPPDAFPNVGPPGVETGVVAVMVRVDGRWLLDEGALEPQACA